MESKLILKAVFLIFSFFLLKKQVFINFVIFVDNENCLPCRKSDKLFETDEKLIKVLARPSKKS